MITLPGVDLSSFQGAPGQWRGMAGSISWAGVKWTERSSAGPYINPDAAADWAALGGMGAGRVGYLFGHPSIPPGATVRLFAEAITPVLTDGDGIALDLEVADGLGAAEVAAWGRSVLALMEKLLHRRPVLYTFLSFAAAGNCTGMGGYPLWIADPSHPAGKPDVPAPWKSWAIHQYASSPLDRDVAAYPSLAAMKAALGKPAPKPKPAPRREPVQLNTGPGAVTPIAFRDGETKARFFPASGDHVSLSVEFNGHPAESVTLTGGAGAVAIPKGALGCRVVRGAAGATVAVSVVTE